jgi:ribosomal-protein-alanine N-acetyltransferase
MTVIDERPASAATQPPPPRVAARSAVWLETPEWQLMAVTPAHAPLLARLHERNGDHFRLAMSLEPAMADPAFWERALAEQARALRDGTGVFLVGFLKSNPQPEVGCVISFAGIVHDEFDCCWLGFRMDRSLQGRGLMRAALMPAIAAMFARHGLHRIMASHQPENLRSAAVLRSLGFGIEGYSRDFMKVNGEWKDNVLLSLIAQGA